MERSDEGGESKLDSAPEASSDSEMSGGGEDVDADDYDGENDGVVGDDDDQEETSKGTFVKPLPTEWTNEKHSLYLKSIEASFVDQLYNTMGFRGFEPARKASIEPKPHFLSSIRTSAGQFKTLRGGYWQKINVGKSEHQPGGQNTPDALLSNPWIRHYRHSERHHFLEPSVCQGKAAPVDEEINSNGKAALAYRFNRSLKISNAGLYNTHRPVFTDNGTEASGQNFINEDVMNMEEKLSSLCNTQQVKTRPPMNDSSNNNHLEVP